MSIANSRGNMPVHTASIWGSVGVLKMLIQADKEVMKRKNQDGETPLTLASLEGK